MAIPETSSYTESVAEEQKTWKGHVLVMPYPAQGHINPMMHLSHHLAARGVLVTFVNTQFNHDRILRSRATSPHTQTYDAEGRIRSRHQFPDIMMGSMTVWVKEDALSCSQALLMHSPSDAEAYQLSRSSIRLVGIPDGLGYDEYVANFSVPKQVQALIDLEPALMKLVGEIQPPVTCIIADVFVISTYGVARHFHIPHVAFWTQSAASYAAHLFFTQNHASLKEYLEKLQGEGKMNEREISCVPSCPTMSYKELPTFLQPCDPSDFLFSYLIKNFQMAPLSTFVLMNTFEKLEEESLAYIHGPNIHCIAPLLPPQFILDDSNSSPLNSKRNIPTLGTSFWVEDNIGCLPWLHQQKPSSVLYVSFGSITLMSAQQITEFALGLEASDCPFLMVVRPEMMEGAISMTFPDGFVGKMKDSGRATFVEWAPQLEVLAHPAIGGFFTHAGWNSTLESICRGVPMLCWPYFADQMINARCIVDTWKIGLDFVTENVMINKECKNSSCGNYDNIDSTRNSTELPLVKCEQIEQKIRQLMDPLTSIEIRKQIKIFSLAAKREYESSSCSTFKSLLNVISN